jgi:hypothetical protein
MATAHHLPLELYKQLLSSTNLSSSEPASATGQVALNETAKKNGQAETVHPDQQCVVAHAVHASRFPYANLVALVTESSYQQGG